MKPFEWAALGVVAALAGYLVWSQRRSDAIELRRLRMLERANELEAKRLYLQEQETRKDWEPAPVPPERQALAEMLERAGGDG